MLAAVLFINYVDRGALPTAAHLIDADIGLSKSQLGLLFSAFFWTYSLMQIPVGWLAERYGARRVLSLGLAVWASATMLIGTAHTFAALLGLRLLLGIGESVGFPCVSKLLASAVRPHALGMANGIVAFAYLFGPAVGTYAGGQLMAHYGWRSAFLVFGASSLLWLLPWSRVRLPLHATVRQDAATPTFVAILKQRALWGTCLGMFSNNYAFYFMLTWMPTYLVEERGFSTVGMAQLAGSAYLVTALSALGTGWATDRSIRRGRSSTAVYKTAMATAHAGFVACMLCMALASRPWALGAMFVFQMLIGASSPGAYAIPQILAGPRAAGRWVGIHNSVGNLAGVVAPAATGFIIDATGHFTFAFIAAAALSLLGLVGWWPMLPKLEGLDWAQAPAGPAAVADDEAMRAG